MDYFKYIEKATKPHWMHLRIERTEKRNPRLKNEFDANRKLVEEARKKR